MDNQEQPKRYDELAQKLLDGTISDAEMREYLDWLNRDEDDALNIPAYFAEDREQLKNRIFSPLKQRKVVSFKRAWYAAAAAIVLIVAGYYWMHTGPKTQKLISVNKQQVDVMPGTTGAILTLANGQQLVLDSLGNGIIATQGKTNVAIQNGQLVYNVLQPGRELLYNTMSTPKGRQYQLLLPDGSKVWLNAASSIRFPIAFNAEERRVTMTGEAYFEVAKDTKKPFIVDVDGKANVQVLGTHFNINSYGDEQNFMTTLLEGSVVMKSEVGSRRSENQKSIILKPGQQAELTHDSRFTIHDNIDLDQVMAWKNGYFQFNETKLELVLKQLERWYNIDVVFEGKIPQETFVGELPANAPLSQILRVLEKTQVNFEIKGKQLIVKQ